MLSDTFRSAPTAGLLVLLQRAFEELYSEHNTRSLLVEGAWEQGRDLSPIVAATHLCRIGLALRVSPQAPVPVPLAIILVLQPLRYWTIATLSRSCIHRIISVPGAPIVTHGTYWCTRRPNSLVLPVVFAQFAFAVIFTTLWIAALRHRIQLEDVARAKRRLRVEAVL